MLSYAYDLAGRRTRLTWWDGVYVNYDRLVTGELSKVRLNGATSGSGVLATFSYDSLGSRIVLARGNGMATTYTFDPLSRLKSLTHNLAGSTYDLTITLGNSPTVPPYNPASQIASVTRSNDAYAFTGHSNMVRAYTSNGLNQHVTAGPASLTYDGNGNLTGDGTTSFTYDIENKLTSATSGGTTKTLGYDPLNRLDRYVAGTGYRFIYDGSETVAELNGAGTMLRRFVRGDSPDEILLEYVGAGTTDPRYHHLDERGSDIAWSDSSGAMSTISSYDEYGVPASSNPGRFQYTGQMWLPEISVYNYKSRIYSPVLGRFLQSDPVGYRDGLNWYAYVHNDPANMTDPLGLGSEDNGGCAGIANARCSDPPITGTCFGGPASGGGCTTTNDVVPPRYDPLTGNFGNYYYSAAQGFFWQSNGTNVSDYASMLSGGYQPDLGAAGVYNAQYSIPKGLGGGWKFAERLAKGGWPFFALRLNHHGGTDTISFTRSQALTSAKWINGVPSAATPLMVYTQGRLGGGDGFLDRNLNAIYYVFLNSSNILIGVREDFATQFQPPHFNSGPALSVTLPSQDLNSHSYYVGS